MLPSKSCSYCDLLEKKKESCLYIRGTSGRLVSVVFDDLWCVYILTGRKWGWGKLKTCLFARFRLNVFVQLWRRREKENVLWAEMILKNKYINKWRPING